MLSCYSARAPLQELVEVADVNHRCSLRFLFLCAFASWLSTVS